MKVYPARRVRVSRGQRERAKLRLFLGNAPRNTPGESRLLGAPLGLWSPFALTANA